MIFFRFFNSLQIGTLIEKEFHLIGTIAFVGSVWLKLCSWRWKACFYEEGKHEEEGRGIKIIPWLLRRCLQLENGMKCDCFIVKQEMTCAY